MSQIYFSRKETASHAATSAQDSSNGQAESGPQLFTISTYNNERDNIPKQRDWSWSEFCKVFSKHHIRNKKLGTQMWSATQYQTGAKRGKAGVESISMAVLDIDNGTPVEQVIGQIDGYAYLIHSSYSHTEEHPKYRVIIPLVKPSETQHWPIHWARINHWLGNINDPAVKDESRGYFIPCHPTGADHFTLVGEGRCLSINELPEVPAGFVSSVTKHPPKPLAKVKVKVEGIEDAPADLSPAKGLVEIVDRCRFMQWACNPLNQEQVSEPQWMAMISNACFCQDSEAWIHNASCKHSGYDEEATDRKVERLRESYAPITCQRIQALGFDQCPAGGCQLHSGLATKAPAGLWTWLLRKPIELPFATQQGGN